MTDHKAIIQAFFERLNQGDLAGAEALMTQDSTHHMAGAGRGEQSGAAAWRAVSETLLEAFPDRRFVVHHMVGENKKVAVRLTWTATHRGVYASTPPTDRPVEVNGMSVFRVEHGKIAEQWIEEDILALHQQIGAAPGYSKNWP